mmetsp:Transcript_11481/g.26137  ORF Transcript_11481/g.26137 Transcript_11481/m.26137 type:complete len:202 (+) Transcript_11481:40-645(+)
MTSRPLARAKARMPCQAAYKPQRMPVQCAWPRCAGRPRCGEVSLTAQQQGLRARAMPEAMQRRGRLDQPMPCAAPPAAAGAMGLSSGCRAGLAAPRGAQASSSTELIAKLGSKCSSLPDVSILPKAPQAEEHRASTQKSSGVHVIMLLEALYGGVSLQRSLSTPHSMLPLGCNKQRIERRALAHVFLGIDPMAGFQRQHCL